MKIKRTISILVLVCFFFTSVVVQPQKQAEAVAPIVAVLVDAAVCAAISAGVTYAIPEIEKHIARNQISKMSEMEKRALEIEGGLSEMTVADAKRLGIKTKPGAKRIFKLKGPGKAALISGILTIGIAGISYGIDYFSHDDYGDCDYIDKEITGDVEYETGYCSGERTVLVHDTAPLSTRYYYLGLSEGQYGRILYNSYSYGDNWRGIERLADGRVYSIVGYSGYQIASDSSWIALDANKDGGNTTCKGSCSGVNDKPLGRMFFTREAIGVIVEGQGNYTLGKGIEVYHYTGTVPAEDIAVTDSPYVDAQRERLEQAKDDDEKIIYLIQNDDGSVDVETSTELEDGTEIVDLSPTTGPTTPADPTENGKPDLNDLYGVVTTRWPFSLPWDIGHLINLVICEPIPPRWEFTLPESMGEHTFVIDMAQYEDIMNIVRWFITFGFCFGIVLVIRKLYGGSV